MTTQFNPRTKSRGIEWCDETRNWLGGCKHACRWQMPDGTIAVCYAEELANNGVAAAGYPHGFEHHYFRENGLKQLTAGSQPLLIFCDSMSDMFGSWIPRDELTAGLRRMKDAPHHAYQGLTKAPRRILQFIDELPPNLWVGASSAPDFMMGNPLTEHQKSRYTTAALDSLRQVKEQTGNLVWMSLEPVSWDMSDLLTDHPLDWVVIGAASKGRRYFQPDPAHIARLLEVFDASGTPVFFKGNIKPCIKENGLGRWREDFPAVYRDGAPIAAVSRRQELARKRNWTLNAFAVQQASLF